MLKNLAYRTYTNFLPHFKRELTETFAPMAVLADEMTALNFSLETKTCRITPANYKRLITPDTKLFFCESAWAKPWRGMVYNDRRVPHENRVFLLAILKHCHELGVPTVFWNKEDPTYFGHAKHDFADTALLFDHILTTAEECISLYQRCGAQSVHLFPFAYSDKIYFDTRQPREHRAVFAGSWFTDHAQRCADMVRIFDETLATMPLTIYKRQGSSDFPAKYQPYVKPAIAYEQLGDIYRSVTHVININTVTTSQTMFARRYLETLACGCQIITNSPVTATLPGNTYTDRLNQLKRIVQWT